MPCESVETEGDFLLFGDERDSQQGLQFQKLISKDGDQLSTGTRVSDEGAQAASLVITQAEAPQEEAPDTDKGAAEGAIADGNAIAVSTTDEATVIELQQADVLQQSTEIISGEGQELSGGDAMNVDGTVQPIAPETTEGTAEGGEDEREDLPAPTRMRTRAQAQAVSDNATPRTRSATPDSNVESFIHPYFLAPPKAHPDRDLGLPQHEAEETRRLLQLYIQKQEEVCRGAERVYHGLLRADRCRRLVMKWAKAEAHVGVNRDMSDGEDWYDKEEWGLDDDLKKGQDEEEEDAATTAKKTRTRRQ